MERTSSRRRPPRSAPAPTPARPSRARRGAAPAASPGRLCFPLPQPILRVAAPPPLLGERLRVRAPPTVRLVPQLRLAVVEAAAPPGARRRRARRARRRAPAAPRPRAAPRPWHRRSRSRRPPVAPAAFRMVSCASIKSASRTRCCRKSLAFALASLRTALKQSASVITRRHRVGTASVA